MQRLESCVEFRIGTRQRLICNSPQTTHSIALTMASPAKVKAMATSHKNTNTILEPFQRFWRKTPYAGDYLGLAIILVAYLTIQIIDVEPFHRMFRLDDPRIQFPHAEVERVPVRTYNQPLSTKPRITY